VIQSGNVCSSSIIMPPKTSLENAPLIDKCLVRVHQCVVECGGSLVDSMPSIRRVVGSNHTLVVMQGTWASPSLAVACGALV